MFTKLNRDGTYIDRDGNTHQVRDGGVDVIVLNATKKPTPSIRGKRTPEGGWTPASGISKPFED